MPANEFDRTKKKKHSKSNKRVDTKTSRVKRLRTMFSVNARSARGTFATVEDFDAGVPVLPSGADPDSNAGDDNSDYHTADEDDVQEVVNTITREERTPKLMLDVSVQTDPTNPEPEKEDNAVSRDLVQPIRPPAAIQPGTARRFLETIRELHQEAVKISQKHNKLVGVTQSIKQGIDNAIQREQDRNPLPNRPKGLRDSLQKLLFPVHKAAPSQSTESPLAQKEELPDVKLEIREEVPQIKIKDEEIPLDLSALDADLFPAAPSSRWQRSSSHPRSDPSDAADSDPETRSPKRKRSPSGDEEEIDSSKRCRMVGPRSSAFKGKAKAEADDSESEDDDIVTATPQEREAADLRLAIELSRESHRAQQLLEHSSVSAAHQLAAEISDEDRYGHLPQYRYEKLKKEFDDAFLHSDNFDRLSAEDQEKVTEMISSLVEINNIVNDKHYEPEDVVRAIKRGCKTLQSVLGTLESR